MMKFFFFLFFAAASLFADAHILLYHRFDDNKPKLQHMNISSKLFSEQIAFLKENGYKFVPLSQLVADIKAQKPIADKTICITIDDAYKSFYKSGFPILKNEKIPFTMYVYVQAVNEHYPDYMSWNELKEISHYGSVELHSYAHKDLTKLSSAALAKDTSLALSIFEKRMGYKPKSYAYPFGLYDQTVRDALRSYGFETIMTVDSGAVDAQSDLLGLERIAVTKNIRLASAISVKPLDITITKTVSDKNIKTIYGTIQNFSGKTIKVYIGKTETKNVQLNGNAFELQIDMNKLNTKRKLIFYTDDHRYRVKLLSKE